MSQRAPAGGKGYGNGAEHGLGAGMPISRYARSAPVTAPRGRRSSAKQGGTAK